MTLLICGSVMKTQQRRIFVCFCYITMLEISFRELHFECVISAIFKILSTKSSLIGSKTSVSESVRPCVSDALIDQRFLAQRSEPTYCTFTLNAASYRYRAFYKRKR